MATTLIGHDPGTIELVRHGSNSVYRALDSDLLLRYSATASGPDVRANMDAVRELAAAGAPVVPPARPEPLVDGPHVLTVWPLGAPASADSEPALGRALAHLHRTPIAEALSTALPEVNPYERIEQRLRLLDAVPVDITDELHARATRTLNELDHRRADARVVVHGDAHIGNLVQLAGNFLLVDLDDLCVGPPEFDLAPALVSFRRFHRDEASWSRFVSGYGGEPDWSLVDAFCRLREVTMNTWLATLWNRGAEPRRELRHRLETWDQPWDSHRPWIAQ